jgi:hypothetical protein
VRLREIRRSVSLDDVSPGRCEESLTGRFNDTVEGMTEPTAAELAERIERLPGVEQQALEDGQRFFFMGADRRNAFATIVERNVPGWDEESRLDRDGVFRFNVELGRKEFVRLFGFAPAELDEHRGEFDFAALDRVQPHPAYGTAGWGCVLNPAASLPEVERLLAYAHGKRLRRAGAEAVEAEEEGL